MRILLVAAALLQVLPATVRAHDFPADVILQLFLKPSGQRLVLIARVPLITLDSQGAPLGNVEVPRRGPGYLELDRIDGPLRVAATALEGLLDVYENNNRVGNAKLVNVRVSLYSDQSFSTYTQALAHVTGPALPAETDVYWNQGFFDALFEYPIQSDQSEFSIHPRIEAFGQRVSTVLGYLLPGGTVRAYQLHGDPGRVRLDPRWYHSALLFVESGFQHILGGVDHLLFLCCLIIPFRRFRALVPIVTAFTVAHSVTLIAAAYDMAPSGAWFPLLVEALIATSIVYMALENIVAVSVGRRWIITFAFGLVHGFGFSFALRERLPFAGSHLLLSLLSFNIGVELGQIVVLAVVVPALVLLLRFVLSERVGVILLSALVAHTGWHWMLERATPLADVEWPLLEVLSAVRVVLLVAMLATLGAIVWGVLRRRTQASVGTAP